MGEEFNYFHSFPEFHVLCARNSFFSLAVIQKIADLVRQACVLCNVGVIRYQIAPSAQITEDNLLDVTELELNDKIIDFSVIQYLVSYLCAAVDRALFPESVSS